MISFFVPGIPKQQGSKRGFVVNGRAVLVEASAGVKPWRQDVRAKAEDVMFSLRMNGENGLGFGRRLLDGPVRLNVAFRFPRPKSHYNRKGLKSNAPLHVSRSPDLDKLIRAIGDALTGVVWADDRLIAQIYASKTYDEQPGVSIGVEEV